MTAIGTLRNIVMGVIRDASFYRPNNPLRERADAEYKAVRPAFIKKRDHKCEFCGFQSPKYIECHHSDGNHSNNAESNFVAADTLCHAYHHIGQHGGRVRFGADALRGVTLCAAVPEVSIADMNLLQRAIGAALLDESSASEAREILKALVSRREPVREAFESFLPEDFAAAMMSMSADAYSNREVVMGDLRLIFHVDVLKHEGQRFLEENASLPISTWDSIARNAHSQN
jgi:intracellular multiplication protein IcmJ